MQLVNKWCTDKQVYPFGTSLCSLRFMTYIGGSRVRLRDCDYLLAAWRAVIRTGKTQKNHRKYTRTSTGSSFNVRLLDTDWENIAKDSGDQWLNVKKGDPQRPMRSKWAVELAETFAGLQAENSMAYIRQNVPMLGFLQAYAVNTRRRAVIPSSDWKAGWPGRDLKWTTKKLLHQKERSP